MRPCAAATQVRISSGSPLTIPMMLRRSMTSKVARITPLSVLSAGTGRSHGGIRLNVMPSGPALPLSHRGMTANGAHIGGGSEPA